MSTLKEIAKSVKNHPNFINVMLEIRALSDNASLKAFHKVKKLCAEDSYHTCSSHALFAALSIDYMLRCMEIFDLALACELAQTMIDEMKTGNISQFDVLAELEQNAA